MADGLDDYLIGAKKEEQTSFGDALSTEAKSRGLINPDGSFSFGQQNSPLEEAARIASSQVRYGTNRPEIVDVEMRKGPSFMQTLSDVLRPAGDPRPTYKQIYEGGLTPAQVQSATRSGMLSEKNAASKSDVFAKPVMQETEQEDLNRYTEMMAAPTPGPAERESIQDILSKATSDLETRKERARGATLIGSDRQSMIMNVLVKQTKKSWNELTPKEREDISGWARQIARIEEVLKTAEDLGITVDRTANKDIPSAVKFIESRIEKIERDASKLGVDLGNVAGAKRDLAQQTGKSVFEISDKDALQHAQFTRLENTYAEKVGTTDKYELRRIVEDEISSASRSSKKGEDFRISRKAREASEFLAFLQAKESPDVDKELLSELVGKSSGFSKSTIDEYLKSRKDAMERRKGMLDVEIKAQQLIDARNANEIFPENAAIERRGKIASVQKSQADAATALEKSRASRAVSDFALSSKQASDVMADIQTELAKKGTGKNGPNITALGEKYRGKGASAFSDYEKGLSIYYEFLRTGGNK